MAEENNVLRTANTDGIQSLYVPIKQYWKLAAGILILILGFTFFKAYFAKKYYQVTFFISCNYPLVEDLKISGNNLKVYNDPSFSQAELKALSVNYQIITGKTEPALRQINVNTSRITRENNSCEITLQVYDSAKVATLVSGFVSYLNKNAYLSKNLDLDRKRAENVLNEIDKQIGALKVNSNAGESDIKIKEANIGLIEKREAVLSRLDKLKGFEISVPPVIPGNYANLPMIKQLILATIWGGILAVAVAFFAGIIWPKKN